MRLTDRELEFVTRLVGNHMSGQNKFIYDLYLKLHKSALFHGMDEDVLDTPLNLEDRSFARGDERDIFFDVLEEEFK